MDIWENASLTEKGAGLQNKLMNGESLKITKVKTGAGKVSAMYLRQQTDVTNPVQELTLQPATIVDENIIIPVLLENIGLTEGYELWQVGFYAEDPDEGEILYCIAQAAKGKEIPAEQESPGYSIVWNFHFKNSEENPFELNITPAGLTSMRTFQEHANDVDIHVTLEEKNIFSDKYTKAEIDNKFSSFETNIDWKEAVDTYTDILEMYPKPQDGWTVNVKDTDYTYRFNGADWVAISSNSIPNATSELNGLMTKEQVTVLNKLDNAVGSLQNLTTNEKRNLVGAVNEVKSQVTQLNSDLANKTNDTGWINTPLATGVYNLSNSAQPLRYRRKNGIVYVTGVVKVTGKNADVQKTITTLPAGFRITSGSYYYFINGATGSTLSRYIIGDTGTITLEWVRKLQDGSALSGDITWIGINISYPI